MRYDAVEFDHPDGSHQRLRPEQFEAMPLLERVQWISQGRFQFFKQGVKVPAYQALKPER